MRVPDRTILIVDDEADIVASVRELLVGVGYLVETASDGEEALKKLVSGRRPSLMILDLKMPKKSGQEVLRALRHSTTFIDLPVVILSAHLDRPPIGAVAWLRKPVSPSLLLETAANYTRPAADRR